MDSIGGVVGGGIDHPSSSSSSSSSSIHDLNSPLPSTSGGKRRAELFDLSSNRLIPTPLTIDHKPELPAEKERILATGGNTHPLTHTSSHSYILSLIHPLTHTSSHSHILSLTHPLTHTSSHSYILSLIHPLTHTSSHSHILSLIHPLTHTSSHSYILSLIHPLDRIPLTLFLNVCLLRGLIFVILPLLFLPANPTPNLPLVCDQTSRTYEHTLV